MKQYTLKEQIKWAREGLTQEEYDEIINRVENISKSLTTGAK